MPDEQNRRALVVDDDPSIRGLVSVLLQHDHFVAEVASDGAEAIEKMEKNDFEVVVLDLMMPRVNGHEVIDHLKREHPEMLSRVIVLSAAPTREVRTEPVFAVLSKPFDLAQFRRAVSECSDASHQPEPTN